MTAIQQGKINKKEQALVLERYCPFSTSACYRYRMYQETERHSDKKSPELSLFPGCPDWYS